MRQFRFAVALILATTAAQGGRAAGPVNFNRDIRPLLSDKCFHCHGPDEKKRKAELRLDADQDVFAERKSGRIVTPGKPGESLLYQRLVTHFQDDLMPPPDSGFSLTEAQKELFKRWIEQGAGWSKHWSFLPVTRPAAPEVKNQSWVKNAIDRFIAARLEAEGLQPSPRATKETLIRRLTLDLTGLPPTIAQIDAFLADNSPNAYEKVVDRLLASPHYGERMAVDWLDAARFADTHGYHIDSARDMTSWRRWVIDCFNRNKPFDQFTVEQIAGDLLPGATMEQKLASGFHRNHMINFEGGAIPEEYHAAYIMDRVNTTGMVWLALSLQCASCHEHKYDPISQKEYYQLFAFFHNVPEKGLDGKQGNAEPLLRIATPGQQKRMEDLAARQAALRKQMDDYQPDAAALAGWEKQAGQGVTGAWREFLAEKNSTSGEGVKISQDKFKVFHLEGDNPATVTYTLTGNSDLGIITAIRLEAMPDKKYNGQGPGRSSNGNFVLTDVRIHSKGEPVKIAAAMADFSQDTFDVSQAIDADKKTGWAIHPRMGKSHSALFILDQPIRRKREDELKITLSFDSEFGQHAIGKFKLMPTSATDPRGAFVLPDHLVKIFAVAAEKRTADQRKELAAYYKSTLWPEGRKIASELSKIQSELDELNRKTPTAMVMQEMAQPRDTFMLIRGQYDQKGEPVKAGIPAALGRLPEGMPANRLGLARWLVDKSNPLPSRVTVNRYWQMYFGVGLVKTAEDFGSQGEQPVNPDLLDWLAAEFMDSGWDVKHLQRLIVTSAAYQQSSTIPSELLGRDPENRLLGRGPRFRLSAEFIRDQALAISGLLDARIGGKSVLPYQPPGLWEALAYRQADGDKFTAQTYVQDHGQDLYRRTMYTFWKRTCPPPSLIAFDAPDRETCTVRRSRTNTPLQALVLMNDPTYVESSRKIAERLMTQGGARIEDRITLAFRLATGRSPTARETGILTANYHKQLAIYQADPAAAEKLLKTGESPRNLALDRAELAAWTMVANTILNLDETITKG